MKILVFLEMALSFFQIFKVECFNGLFFFEP